MEGVIDFLQEVVHRNYVFQAGVVGRPFGKELIFDVDAGDAGGLETADGVHGVNRLAVAGVGVANHRQRDGAGHFFGHGKLLGHRH